MNPKMALPILDRLLHHAQTIATTGNSDRVIETPKVKGITEIKIQGDFVERPIIDFSARISRLQILCKDNLKSARRFDLSQFAQTASV